MAADLACIRDYSPACPSGRIQILFSSLFETKKIEGFCAEGWIDVGDGATCKAPLNYAGHLQSRGIRIPFHILHDSHMPFQDRARLKYRLVVFIMRAAGSSDGYQRARCSALLGGMAPNAKAALAIKCIANVLHCNMGLLNSSPQVQRNVPVHRLSCLIKIQCGPQWRLM